MKIFSELILYCFVFTILVKLFAGKSPLDCLYFYPEEYQRIAYERKLADENTVRKKRKRFLYLFIPVMFILLIIIIHYINGIRHYWPAYFQSLLFLEIMNWYDGFVIDELWVGNDSFWYIEEMKDMEYVQSWKKMFEKRIRLSFVWLIGSFLCSAIICLL